MKAIINRQLRALEIAKILFEAEGYHTKYLQEIEQTIKENKGGKYVKETQCQATR